MIRREVTTLVLFEMYACHWHMPLLTQILMMQVSVLEQHSLIKIVRSISWLFTSHSLISDLILMSRYMEARHSLLSSHVYSLILTGKWTVCVLVRISHTRTC